VKYSPLVHESKKFKLLAKLEKLSISRSVVQARVLLANKAASSPRVLPPATIVGLGWGDGASNEISNGERCEIRLLGIREMIMKKNDRTETRDNE